MQYIALTKFISNLLDKENYQVCGKASRPSKTHRAHTTRIQYNQISQGGKQSALVYGINISHAIINASCISNCYYYSHMAKTQL